MTTVQDFEPSPGGARPPAPASHPPEARVQPAAPVTRPDNCVNMTAVRFGDRVTITVTSTAGNKSSATVDADHPLYVWFLRVADHELLWDNPIHPRDDYIDERQMNGDIPYAPF